MANSQEAPMPQIPQNLRNYGISELWAESAPLLVANSVNKFLHILDLTPLSVIKISTDLDPPPLSLIC